MANHLDPQVMAVALDFDGVITNLDIDWAAAIRRASQIAGYNVRSLLSFYEEKHGTTVFQSVNAEMEKVELVAVQTAQPKPFLAEFLTKLKAKQVPAYIVSMQSVKPIQTFLEKHNLTNYFAGILTRENCPTKAAQLQCVANQTGFSPSQILLVDDAKRNIERCKELGNACFQFKRDQKTKEAAEAWEKILKLAHAD